MNHPLALVVEREDNLGVGLALLDLKRRSLPIDRVDCQTRHFRWPQAVMRHEIKDCIVAYPLNGRLID